MKALNQYEVFLNRHSVPCFLAHFESFEILYMNHKMELLLGKRKDVIGQKFYHVIKDEVKNDDKSYKAIVPQIDWTKKDMIKNKIYDKTLKEKFDVTVYKVELLSKSYLLCEYVTYDHEEVENYNLELALNQTLNILQENDNIIPKFLQLVGEYYLAEHCCLYRISIPDKEIFLTDYWESQESRTPTADISSKMPVEKIFQWMNSRNDMGMLEVGEIQSKVTHNSIEMEILSNFKIDDMVVSLVVDQNAVPIAAIALVNRKDIATEYSFLQAVTAIIKQEISKDEISFTVDKLVYNDLLTGCYRRSYYSVMIDTLKLAPPQSMGVIFANVNGLKHINHDFGYSKGDVYIQKVAEILKNHFQTDFYRISGDEFVGLFPEIQEEELLDSINNLLANLTQEQKSFFAIGHAWSEGNYNTEDLVLKADNLMYINKQNYYHSTAISDENIHSELLLDLLTALEQGEFMIYLQGQINLEDGSLHGAEALIRRYDKDLQRIVFPDQFISLYEKQSIIRHVDIFVAEKVCQLLRQWLDQGIAPIPISVNFSRVTLLEYGIVEIIADICDQYQVPRKYMVIEITERMGLLENHLAGDLVRKLKKEGFQISLDDFGCAYSNMITLAEIEFDEVKLDKSLIDHVTYKEKHKVLVENIIRMCQSIGDITLLAEGIETEEQSKLLIDLGCKTGQGYFYSRPLPVEDFCSKYHKDQSDG